MWILLMITFCKTRPISKTEVNFSKHYKILVLPLNCSPEQYQVHKRKTIPWQPRRSSSWEPSTEYDIKYQIVVKDSFRQFILWSSKVDPSFRIIHLKFSLFRKTENLSKLERTFEKKVSSIERKFDKEGKRNVGFQKNCRTLLLSKLSHSAFYFWKLNFLFRFALMSRGLSRIIRINLFLKTKMHNDDSDYNVCLHSSQIIKKIIYEVMVLPIIFLIKMIKINISFDISLENFLKKLSRRRCSNFGK